MRFLLLVLTLAISLPFFSSCTYRATVSAGPVVRPAVRTAPAKVVVVNRARPARNTRCVAVRRRF